MSGKITCDDIEYDKCGLYRTTGANGFNFIIEDMLGNSMEKRLQVINAAVDKFGVERVRLDALNYFKATNRSYWQTVLMRVLNDRKKLAEYMNISRELLLIEGNREFPTYAFTEGDEYVKQREKILRSIRECRTRGDLTELFSGDPHSSMVMGFLKYWLESINIGR